MEEVTKKLADLEANYKTAATDAAKNEIKSQMDALKAELGIEAVKRENATMKADIDKMKSDAALNQKALDELIAKQKTIPATPQYKGVAHEMGEQLIAKKEALTQYRQGNGKGFTVDLSTKVVGNMASSTSLTGSYFVAPTVVPGITARTFEEVHMRDLLPVGATDSNVIRYVRDNGGEGGPAMVAEGGTKPQIDRDLAILDSNVRKIATYFRIPEEMIDDIPYLQSFLTAIGLEELMAVEDTQIIYGSGSGQNLSGLYTNATAFSAGNTTTVVSPNQFDVLRAARKQIRQNKLGGQLTALVSPEDYYEMTSRKDTTNNYLFLGGGNGISIQNPSVPGTGSNIGGIRIEEHTAMNNGEFLVFQPRAAQIFDRTGTSIRFYDQDQDNAIKNLITIVIEKRLALAIYRPLGIVKGTFDAAIGDLLTGS